MLLDAGCFFLSGLLSEDHAVGREAAGAGEGEEFSLVLGGPLYQFLLRSKLIRPPFGNLGWRIGVITGLAWLPREPLARPDPAGRVRRPV